MSAIIDELVALIRGARYGRDVRESIAHGIEVIDDVAEGARDSATASATAAQGYAQAADQSASNAHTSETNAGASATTASQKATLSESWAVGGTGTRTGEDTNNAKYWSEQAEGAVTGVTSFNGRRGVVVPANGDYSITQIDGSGTAGKVAVTDGNGHMVLTDTGQANGIASLDGNGRVPYTQLPESAMEFKGTWNANTNTPTLTSGVGDSGDFYVVSVGGTWNNIDFNVNDRIIFDGVTAHDWIRLVAGEVNSVNGQSGQVLLDAEDIPFDKKTSPLTSTDTNSAILEVLQKAGVQVVSTTMADYLAHKSEYDASGNLIDITDSGVANSAGNVSYDNTNSGLASVTAQGAIDEIYTQLKANTYITTGLTFATGVSLGAGGYFKLGHIVVVNMRLIISGNISTNANLVTGLPSMAVLSNACEVTNSVMKHMYLNLSGQIRMSDSLTSTNSPLLISTVYICN